MRQSRVALLFAALSFPVLGAPAHSQDLTEIPEDLRLPTSIEATLNGTLEAGDVLDRIRRWEGDLVGDPGPDQVVQAAISVGGGNAIYLRQWIFERRGKGFVPLRQLDLADGIKAARRDGHDLVLLLYKTLPDDPLCCPSGEEVVRVPLN